MRRLATALLFALIGCGAARADEPVKIVVPFAAGGGSDTVARIIASKLSDRLGQPVTIENRGGAGGNLGMDAGAHAPDNGYTLTVITQNLVVNPHLYKNLGYDPQDFRPLALLNRFYQIVVVNPALPARTLAELRSIQDWVIRFGASRAEGVAEVAGHVAQLDPEVLDASVEAAPASRRTRPCPGRTSSGST